MCHELLMQVILYRSGVQLTTGYAIRVHILPEVSISQLAEQSLGLVLPGITQAFIVWSWLWASENAHWFKTPGFRQVTCRSSVSHQYPAKCPIRCWILLESIPGKKSKSVFGACNSCITFGSTHKLHHLSHAKLPISCSPGWRSCFVSSQPFSGMTALINSRRISVSQKLYWQEDPYHSPAPQ